MKYITMLGLLTILMSNTAQAEIVIPCDGTYASSQAWLADIGGTAIQGSRSLGSIKLKVRACGNTITISADGMNVSLGRISSDSNTFKGKHKGTPNLEFTLNAKTPQHISGRMIASDGQLTLKRPLAVILQSGSAPKLENCEAATVPTDLRQYALSVIDLFKYLALSPKSGFGYEDYIHDDSNTEKRQSSVYFYIDHSQSVLAKLEREQGFVSCSTPAVKDFLVLPKIKAKFNILPQGDSMSFQLQIIDVSSEFKILQEHSVKASGNSKEDVANAMIALWKLLKPVVEIKSMSGSI